MVEVPEITGSAAPFTMVMHIHHDRVHLSVDSVKLNAVVLVQGELGVHKKSTASYK
jgi:hypothetical protein